MHDCFITTWHICSSAFVTWLFVGVGGSARVSGIRDSAFATRHLQLGMHNCFRTTWHVILIYDYLPSMRLGICDLENALEFAAAPRSSMPTRFPARKNTLNTWLMRLGKEFIHGRNRKRAHMCTIWATLTAHCFFQEGSRTQTLQQHALSLLRPEQRLRATCCAESDRCIAKKSRKKNLYDLVCDQEINLR